MHHDVMRFAQVASRVWGCSMDFAHPEVTAKAGIAAFKSFLQSIGMPTSFAELGAGEDKIDEMAEKACYGDGRTGFIGGFAPLSKDDVANIYRLML